jgi:hypothetical protein
MHLMVEHPAAGSSAIMVSTVGEYDIEPAAHRCRFVDHAIQRGSVSHVRDRNRRPTRRMTWFAVFLLASSRVGCWPW